MRKAIITLSVITVMAFAAAEAFSQGWGRGNGFCNGPGYGRGYGYRGGPGMSGRNIDSMKYELDLTDNQIKKIFKLGSEFRGKYFENRNNRDKIQSLRIEHRKAIENVLTAKQKDKYKSYNSYGGRFGWFGGCYNSNP